MGKIMAHLSLEKTIVGILVILVVTLQVLVAPSNASALLTTQTTISSLGSITYNQSPSGLPLSVLGDDYLIFQGNHNGQPNGVPSSTWTSERLAKFTQYHCSVARLGLIFKDAPGNNGVWVDSFYDKTKMSQVLDLLGSVGVKGILLLQNNGDCNGFFGSTAMVNDWVQVAKLLLSPFSEKLARLNVLHLDQ
jgi:hypothetical protein